MIIVNNNVYDLTKSEDRENLHTIVDDYVTQHYDRDIFTEEDNETKHQLEELHTLISERFEEALAGRWFNGGKALEIELFIDDITDFLDEMEIEYYPVDNDQLEIDYNGYLYLMSRRDVSEAVKRKYVKTFILPDGNVYGDEHLSKMGLYTESHYYLSKSYK